MASDHKRPTTPHKLKGDGILAPPPFAAFCSSDDAAIVDAEGGLVLGIDPGLSGGIAVLNPGLPLERRVVAIYDMPVTTSKGGAKRVDVAELASIFGWHAPHARLIVVEEVGPSPQQGVVSAFSFGMGFGMILGVAAGFPRSPVHLVKPSVWKMRFGLSTDKNESRRLAAKWYPAVAAEVSRKKDDGRAEALLLAHLGLMIETARAKSKVGGA